MDRPKTSMKILLYVVTTALLREQDTPELLVALVEREGFIDYSNILIQFNFFFFFSLSHLARTFSSNPNIMSSIPYRGIDI